MSAGRPNVVVIAGPNGAGKSTIAPELLRDLFSIRQFVNADVIAQGLSGFDPERSAIAAGRLMLERLDMLAGQRADFAFETTLSSRSFAPWLARLCDAGYRFDLVYLWLSSADLACERVGRRRMQGGHGVPEEVVRRRYQRGLRNFFELYRPLATAWRFYDNSNPQGPHLIATGGLGLRESVTDAALWGRIRSASGGSSMVEESGTADELDPDELLREGLEIERVLQRAVAAALLVHKKLGQSIVVWDQGRVRELAPEEIPVRDPAQGEGRR